ncbi:S49 family peptidase [Salmonella enterica]|uniref:S49 family peptidase n=1 Tax=Citrobacter cronae TaxID=1748967 RepID=UPI000FB0123E|nr:S49 family peptidase [Citrobacter cronae]EAR6543143.1 S49 family peptidase [Salmonella enterica]EBG9072085.1 S49 family peptidase [Salmonella enterica]ECO9277082.1 S49 family peptidase [Salmonella enterica]EDQ5478690.1 S49 family peptidase [Salmonella enterica]EDZ6514680.1 S49 family peptidase [Salmonella enterica]
MTTKLINLPHLAEMVFSVPHYATQQTMDAVKAVLLPRIQGTVTDPVITMALNPDDSVSPEEVQPAGGIAVIPVHGILVPRRGQITAMCTELTSYERIRSQLHSALNDPSISEIVLDINSGGGHASGCKELADYIYQSRETKPITAIVNFNAFSAAYFIASACSKIVVSQTSGVGSIGVIMEHLDTSKLEEIMGVKFTALYRGDNKNNGTSHASLSESALAMFDKMLDDMYETFTSSVAEYRGLKQQAVIDTQAGIYFGVDAISAGLADEVSDPQSAINAIAAKYKQPQQTTSIKLQAAAMDLQTRM